MKYNFDTVMNRRNTGSLKWDVAENELPMWVADMDFQACLEIREAFQKRVEQGIFGYSIVPEEWYTAICGWWETRHHFTMEKEWLLFCTGVIPAISSIVRKMTTVGENVLVQTPVYNMFFNSIVNNGRHILDNPLQYNGENYSMDFEDLERKLSDPQTTMMILCNPHNPVGKIWDKETLERVGELCYQYHVLVLSDEIHCDITYPGYEYIPFASVSEHCRNNSITCMAPTKTFNLAGLQSSVIVVPNEQLRRKVDRGINTDEVAEPNSFAVTAVIAAFTKGGEWLDELRGYLFENRKLAEKTVSEIPGVKIVSENATYLLWVDCTKVAKEGESLDHFLRRTTGLYVTDGAHYGKSGEHFLRINIACPRATLEDGLRRLKTGIEEYAKQTLTAGHQ